MASLQRCRRVSCSSVTNIEIRQLLLWLSCYYSHVALWTALSEESTSVEWNVNFRACTTVICHLPKCFWWNSEQEFLCGTTASPLLLSRYQTSGTSKSVVDSAPVKLKRKKTGIENLINLSKGCYSRAKCVLFNSRGICSLCGLFSYSSAAS